MMLYRFGQAMIASLMVLAVPARAQRDISINIYNDGFSQITEKRVIDISEGQDQIAVYDIAEKIDPASISVAGDGFDVKWIDYRYDFVSAERLLYKFLDKKIQFRKGDSLITGILIQYDIKYLFVAPSGWPGPVSMYDRDELKNIDLPELPEGLVSRPMINIGFVPGREGEKEITLSYLAAGLGWSTEYRIGFDGKSGAEFSGWVNLDNQCGLSFPEAEISLVAGKVDRAKPSAGSADKSQNGEIGETGKSPMEPLVDYHRYKLPFKTAVGEKESKQAVLFPAKKIPVDHYYSYKWSETKSDVKSVISFKNDSKSGLGMALPPGRISIYDTNSGVFLGSGEFNGAPAEEKAEIVIGTAFDIKAERKRIDHKKLGRNRNSDTFEIEIRNHKSENAKVIVTEELYGYWEIVEKNADFLKKDFQTVEFEVAIPAGEMKKIAYTAEYSY